MSKVDVIIIGAGAAGLMCAIEAAKRGRKVVVLDHANKPGKKILMSGGGRCNFTNYYAAPENYLSNNPHFCKSALSRYTQWDFISLVEKYQIPYYEKTLGQLFCKNKAKDIVNMLLTECELYGAQVILNTSVVAVSKTDSGFILNTLTSDKTKTTADSSHKIKIPAVEDHQGRYDNCYDTDSLVIASGGLSIPTMGATSFGYRLAERFGLEVLPTRAGLVPFWLDERTNSINQPLSGISLPSSVTCNKQSFIEGILFTHRGISGPSILQISSYWQKGEVVSVNLLPNINLEKELLAVKQAKSDKTLKNILADYLPKNLVNIFLLNYLKLNVQNKNIDIAELKLKHLSHQDISDIADLFHGWQIKPVATEGYRTAEVTLGGVDVNQISSKTMEANTVKGLYFIGEVLDVTGWLGGYNFQWAWSSGWVAGQYV